MPAGIGAYVVQIFGLPVQLFGPEQGRRWRVAPCFKQIL